MFKLSACTHSVYQALFPLPLAPGYQAKGVHIAGVIQDFFSLGGRLWGGDIHVYVAVVNHFGRGGSGGMLP